MLSALKSILSVFLHSTFCIWVWKACYWSQHVLRIFFFFSVWILPLLEKLGHLNVLTDIWICICPGSIGTHICVYFLFVLPMPCSFPSLLPFFGGDGDWLNFINPFVSLCSFRSKTLFY